MILRVWSDPQSERLLDFVLATANCMLHLCMQFKFVELSRELLSAQQCMIKALRGEKAKERTQNELNIKRVSLRLAGRG